MADLDLRSSERQVYTGDPTERARLIAQRLRIGQITRRRIHAAANAGDAGAKLVCPEDYYNPCGSCGGDGCFSCNDTGRRLIPRGLLPTVRAFPLDLDEFKLCARYTCLCLLHITPESSRFRQGVDRLVREIQIWINTGAITEWLQGADPLDVQIGNSLFGNRDYTEAAQRIEAGTHLIRAIRGLYGHNLGHAVTACYRARGSSQAERAWQIQAFCDVMVGSL